MSDDLQTMLSGFNVRQGWIMVHLPQESFTPTARLMMTDRNENSELLLRDEDCKRTVDHDRDAEISDGM
jgi:hypothetical protein